MISPILLIAGREFRTYVATLSFWLSLALAPLGAGAALLFSGGSQPPAHISIAGVDPSLVHSARLALQEGARLEGKAFLFEQGGARLDVSAPTPTTVDLTYDAGFPLSSEGRALVGRIMERDAARLASTAPSLSVRERVREIPQGSDQGAVSRFVAMMMLWLTLTGSLGMLLQAVVRERANRALESLLAAADGWQIVAGKMLGVGAVSFLVLIAWGGTGAVLSQFAHDGPLAAIAAQFADPVVLLRDAAIYVCAFAFYGAVTVALGAMARDSASAQNVVRPMFVALLAAFFVALAVTSRHSDTLSWLVYVPPFTPFLLLVIPPGSVALWAQIGSLILMLLTAAGFMIVAERLMGIAPKPYQIFRPKIRNIQPVR